MMSCSTSDTDGKYILRKLNELRTVSCTPVFTKNFRIIFTVNNSNLQKENKSVF